MAHLTGNDLFDNQYDNLWEDTGNNPQLEYSKIPSKNKSLDTKNKRIIGSINEILKVSQSVSDSLKSMAEDYNLIIGDFGNDTTLKDKLNEVDENIILSIYKIWNENKQLKTDLAALTTRIETLENKQSASESKMGYKYAEDAFKYSDSNTFKLSHTNICDSDFEFLVNGIEYKINESINLDKEKGTVTWLLSDDKGGFSLSPDYEILVQYWYKE